MMEPHEREYLCLVAAGLATIATRFDGHDVRRMKLQAAARLVREAESEGKESP